MKKILVTALLFFSFSLFAQSAKKSVMVDFILGKAQVLKSGSFSYKELTKNILLNEGDNIRTGKNATVRLMDEKGNQYLLSSNTTLNFASLKDDLTEIQIFTGSSEFNVIKGKKFIVKAPTLAAGVRGTLFRVSANQSGTDQIVVYEGKVEVTSLLKPDEKPIILEGGKKFESNPVDKTIGASAAVIASEEELRFQLAEGLPIKKSFKPLQDQQMKEAVPIMEDKKLTEATQKPQEQKENPQDEIKKPNQKEAKKEDSMFKWNFMAGGIERNGEYYHAMVFSPEMRVGNILRLALYLPVYFDGQTKIYNTSAWGNADEWDFKSSKDAAHDALIKIKYLKIKEKGDMFYLGLGCLDKVTLGSGFIVNEFNLAPLFPVQKIVAMEGGLDAGFTGISLFANDVYDPNIMGGRFFLRPFFGIPLLGKFQMGFSLVVDKKPLTTSDDPAIFIFNLDLIVPLVESSDLALTFFADYGKQGSFFSDWNNRPTTLQKGWDINHFHINRYSYGTDGGLKGKVGKYVLFEFRFYYTHLGFEPNYFDSFYYVNRTQKASVILYGSESDSYAYRFAAGTDLDIFQLSLSFFQAMKTDDKENRLTLHFKTKRGLIYKFWLGFDYEKKHIDNFFTGTDSYKTNAALDIKIGYMINDTSDLVFRKLIQYDEYGVQNSQFLLETTFSF